MKKLVIYGKLPSLNQIININRKSIYLGNKMKREIEDAIVWAIRQQKIGKLKPPLHLGYKWYEEDMRRDADNIVSAQKFIQDAMIKSGAIPNDGRKVICSFSHQVLVDKTNPRIEVDIYEQ